MKSRNKIYLKEWIKKTIKTKDGKDVKVDTLIEGIERMDFDDLRNIVCFDWSKNTPSSETDNEWYNGFEESEVFGWKNNCYLEDYE